MTEPEKPKKPAAKIVVPVRLSPSRVALAQVLAARSGAKYTTFLADAAERGALEEFNRLSKAEQQQVRRAAAEKLPDLEKRK